MALGSSGGQPQICSKWHARCGCLLGFMVSSILCCASDKLPDVLCAMFLSSSWYRSVCSTVLGLRTGKDSFFTKHLFIWSWRTSSQFQQLGVFMLLQVFQLLNRLGNGFSQLWLSGHHDGFLVVSAFASIYRSTTFPRSLISMLRVGYFASSPWIPLWVWAQGTITSRERLQVPMDRLLRHILRSSMFSMSSGWPSN